MKRITIELLVEIKLSRFADKISLLSRHFRGTAVTHKVIRKSRMRDLFILFTLIYFHRSSPSH